MAKNIHIEAIEFKLQGFDKLKSVGQTFEKLNKSLSFTPKQLNETIKSVTKFDARFKGANGTATRSVNVYKQQIAALKELQANVAIGGKSYKAFGAEAKRLRAELEALTNTQKKQKGFFSGIGKGFKAGGATALTGAVGRFLPAGAQVGGAAGFAKTGTIGGAVAGAGVGLAVEGVAAGVKFASEAATYASEIQKLQIALKGVTKDQETFEKGLSVISETSKKLNVPIAASTRQFTTLSASVLGAGGTIEDAETVFTGVSNAIKATGGNAEDVQSAIRAMSQIFGKGKVSAEELQGQLGERLAGAVVKFAEANGSSLQKLQKDLRDGTVGLDQVITFANKLNVDFADTAIKVANSSADAGQRLKVQMDDLKLAVGEAVLPIGAAFQKMFADIVSGITQNKGAMDAIIGTIKGIGVVIYSLIAAVRFLIRTLVDLFKISDAIRRLDFKEVQRIMKQGLADTKENLMDDVKSLTDISGYDAFNVKPIELPATYSVMGVTYDAKTGAAITKPKGLATLTGDKGTNEITKITKGAKMIEQQERQIELSGIQDEKERKILERKFKLLDKLREIRALKETEATDEEKRNLMENAQNLYEIDLLEIKKGKLDDLTDKNYSFAESLRKVFDAATDLKRNIGELAVQGIDKLGDAFADFVVEGKAGFADLARSVIAELQKMIIKALFFNAISKIPFFGNLLGNEKGNAIEGGEVVPSAKGNVFAKNKIIPYKMGGIVDKPTIFPMAKGMGLMGEAGPEGVLPLKRGKDGKLGVIAQGGAINNVNVNVDASGSNAEGDEKVGRQLGEVIGAAIQAELLEQKRPGGLLA